ncbi:MAG: aldo/keto reductase [Bryobacteraceae bacterium]
MSRRKFVGGAVGSSIASQAAGAPSNKTLPTRVFGRSGERVTILAIGCGNRLWAAYKTEDRGVEAVNLALESGIRYFDTAQGYGNGTSETWVGKAVKDRRKEVFVATKTGARKFDDVLRNCELSLKRLQTDYLDVLHIHGLKEQGDLETIENDGTVKALYRLRDQKMVRFIGVTSHGDPATLAKALDRYDFDATQMALNAGLQGRSPDGGGYWKKGGASDLFGEALPPKPHPGSSFEEVALPVAVRKNLGVIAMKVTAQEGLIGTGSGKADTSRLIRYALSLPVSVVTVGMPKLEFIRENTQLARSFKPMSKSERESLSRRLADANKLALDHHFNHEHADS